jgi:hypothetical protein
MTARVCPVHGEYAADGICRWCEPEPATEAVELPGMVGQWRKPDRVEVNEGGVPSYFWDLGTYTLLNPTYMLVSWDAVLREAAKRPVSRQAVDAAEESRLLAQHAALLWERVARRWNYKHRRPGGLDERERAYVWRSWLDQQQRIFDDGDWLRRQQGRFIAAGVPKEWP